jgi:hypothetical protein
MCVRVLGFGPVEVEATTNWLRMVVADVTAVEDGGRNDFAVRANFPGFSFQRQKSAAM